LLQARQRPLQALGQLLAPWLRRAAEQAFARAQTDWAGYQSCLALSFDCDFPEDAQAIPRVVALLQRYGLVASFACVGRWVEDYPDAHRAALEGGHELVNHSWSHPDLVSSARHFVSARTDLNPRPWRTLTRAEQLAEVRRCQEAVQACLGYSMTTFRVPHFGHADVTPLYPCLPSLGVTCSSSVLAARAPRLGLPGWEGALLEVPITSCPRHPYASMDSWHALYAGGGRHRRDFACLVASQLRRDDVTRGLTSIYLDPKDWERLDFDGLFRRLAAAGDGRWVATLRQLASWWAQRYPAGPGAGGG
jgi:peptidoglycan/xylan/chitin deacetylase (PgdA/CDA1 family)